MSSLLQLTGRNFVKKNLPSEKQQLPARIPEKKNRLRKFPVEVCTDKVSRQERPGSPTGAVLLEPIWHQTFRLQQPDTRSHFDLTAEEGFISSWTVRSAS